MARNSRLAIHYFPRGASITVDTGSGLPSRTVEQYRDYLFRYAVLRLRDEARAEDVVQETLLAALQREGTFAGRSSVKTWLTGILKHKIIDQFRRQSRELQAETLDDEGWSLGDDAHAELFFESSTQHEHWRSPPGAWSDPEKGFEQRRIWEVFDSCTKGLSRQAASAFSMRELMGMETDEICKALSITPTNCWVLLYRARMSLRQCLELHWFRTGTADPEVNP